MFRSAPGKRLSCRVAPTHGPTRVVQDAQMVHGALNAMSGVHHLCLDSLLQPGRMRPLPGLSWKDRKAAGMARAFQSSPIIAAETFAAEHV